MADGYAKRGLLLALCVAPGGALLAALTPFALELIKKLPPRLYPSSR
jgi:hypothetical protein